MVREHWHEIYGLLVVLTRNAATAEDLTQDVFVLACRKQIKSGPGIRFWLREAARRLAGNEVRRKRPQAFEPLELERLMDTNLEIESLFPETEFAEKLGTLRICLQGLTEADRAVLHARYGESAPLTDIAAQAAQSVGYIKQRLFRLRQRLAECIKKRLKATTGVSHVPSRV